ncbi:hypothetical protein CXG43_01045 [Stenotrophomonas sp. Bg11-02]|nr:hypothetical protein CXG43_01045 [Stenotrophomonas sp. Bg11-02]
MAPFYFMAYVEGRRTAEPLVAGTGKPHLGVSRAVGLVGGRQEPLLRASFRAIHGAQRPRQPTPPRQHAALQQWL